MPVTAFIESGTDATQDFTFYSLTNGTVASDNTVANTGPRSVKASSGAGNATAVVQVALILQDAGIRSSFAFRFDSLPTSSISIWAAAKAGSGSLVVSLKLNTDGTISVVPTGATTVTGTKVLAINTWYRVAISYTITNTTTFRFDFFVNGVSQGSATAGTLTNTASADLYLGWASGPGANKNCWIDDLYVDKGSDYTDPGNIIVTNKRPNANGTTNGYTTQIGSGGSGYGSGHSPQVNEQPLSTTNGWSMVGVGSAVTEEYTIEGKSVGDVDISASEIVDYMGWIYTKALAQETGNIIVNGANTAVVITTSNVFRYALAGSTIYPSGGADIGEITTTALTTVSLYECGIVFAVKLIRPDMYTSPIEQPYPNKIIITDY